MNLENTFYELYDPTRQNVNYTLAGKLDEQPFMEVEAESYDPLTNIAKVRPIASGAETTIETRVQVHYTGSDPGTGEIFAIVPGERYKVSFVDGYRTGLFSCAEVTGTTYAQKSKPAPAHSAFQQQGVGRLVVDPRKSSGNFKPDAGNKTVLLGNVAYTNDNSESAVVQVGPLEREDLNNETTTSHGTNMPYAEELLRDAVQAFSNASKLLMA